MILVPMTLDLVLASTWIFQNVELLLHPFTIHPISSGRITVQWFSGSFSYLCLLLPTNQMHAFGLYFCLWKVSQIFCSTFQLNCFPISNYSKKFSADSFEVHLPTLSYCFFHWIAGICERCSRLMLLIICCLFVGMMPWGSLFLLERVAVCFISLMMIASSLRLWRRQKWRWPAFYLLPVTSAGVHENVNWLLLF